MSARASLKRFDPWAVYTKQREKDLAAPYEELIDLVGELRREQRKQKDTRSTGRGRYRPPPPLSASAEAAILKWCGRYGLIGLLQHRVERVVLAYREIPSGG